MAFIYWKHKLQEEKAFTASEGFTSANGEDEYRIFSVPQHFATVEYAMSYLCVVHEGKVYAALRPLGPGSSLERTRVHTKDVTQEPFAKEILLKHLLVGA